jgi:hypothetical protein
MNARISSGEFKAIAALDFSPTTDAMRLLHSGKIEEYTNHLTFALRAAVGLLTRTRSQLISTALTDEDAIITALNILRRASNDLDMFKGVLSDAESRLVVSEAAAIMTRPRARKTARRGTR